MDGYVALGIAWIVGAVVLAAVLSFSAMRLKGVRR